MLASLSRSPGQEQVLACPNLISSEAKGDTSVATVPTSSATFVSKGLGTQPLVEPAITTDTAVVVTDRVAS